MIMILYFNNKYYYKIRNNIYKKLIIFKFLNLNKYHLTTIILYIKFTII